MKKYRHILGNSTVHIAKKPYLNIVTMMMHMATRDEGAPSLLQLDDDVVSILQHIIITQQKVNDPKIVYTF